MWFQVVGAQTSMLSLQEEEDLERELRRELILLLHVNQSEYARLPEVDFEEALDGLKEVRGLLMAVSNEHAAIKISVPPLLPGARLREVLRGGFVRGMGREVAFSVRLVPELADTVEVAHDLMEDWSEGGTGVVCFTDEASAGEPSRSLSELRQIIGGKVGGDLLSAFPVNHFDILCVWDGPVDGVVWGPERVVSDTFTSLSKVTVSATARSLDSARGVVVAFHT